MPHLLALDTSTEAMCIALVTPQAEHVLELPGGAQASARLIPETVALLARAGVTLAQLDAIAFGRGPGAFTGLRTACAVTQGLALGAGKPVLPIDSLMLVAEQACGAEGDADVWVAMDARMDEIYAGRYRRSGGRWSTLVEPMLVRAEALAAPWAQEPPAAVAGSALDAFGERLALHGATPLATATGRAAALARLSRLAWDERRAVDVALALPVYVRDKVAQTTAEREAAQAGKAVA